MGARVPSPQQVVAKIRARSVQADNGCIHWTGQIARDGYGRLVWDFRARQVHRAAYELLVGPIPEGLTVDHTCHSADVTCPGGPRCLHRRCINVHHLEVIDGPSNTRRATSRRRSRPTCANGHPRNAENTYWGKGNGSPQCRVCNREEARQYRVRRQMEAAGIRQDGVA